MAQNDDSTSRGYEEEDFQARNPNRASVDWYAGLAADQTHPAASFAETSTLAPPAEAEEEREATVNGAAPEISVKDEDELAEFDLTTSESLSRSFEIDH
jgi:hypothetical protein